MSDTGILWGKPSQDNAETGEGAIAYEKLAVAAPESHGA
jgi:hypothetical protein